MKKFIIYCLMLCMSMACCVVEAAEVNHTFYVSPGGSDSGDGSINSPFLTVARAQEAVRQVNRDMTGDIYVYLREGVYKQTEPLIFTKEDSGSGGYNVIWSSYDGETAEISGGSNVTGWTKYNEKLWVADYDGAEYVRQLWVNGKRARRAQSEEMYDIAEFFKNDGSNYLYDGIVTKETKFADYKNQEDIQLHFSRGWKSFLLNVLSIEKGGLGNKWYMRQPSFTEAERDTMNHNIDAGHNFFVENAFEELDRAGEFYYNRKEKKIYYMPRAGETPETANVVAAELELLMDIKGEDANNRVKNIIFKNLSFAHAAWLRPSYVGLVNDQAQDMHPDREYDVLQEPGYTMVPANIRLNRAKKIQFIGNQFYDFGAVGIGMYQGAINCKVIGNVFYDIADGAMTIGTDDQPYEDKPYAGTNLAANKIVSASSYDSLYSPLKAIDSNSRTGWSPTGEAPHWWQVDLEQEYEIDRVEVDARYELDQAMTRNNFEVLGSNDPNFETYKVLTVCGAEGFPHQGTGIYKVTDSGKYRYVRVRKTNTDYFYIADIRIINESIPHSPGTEICKHVQIQNNYITRTGLVNFGAPGIQAYYVEGIDISNNEIYDVPYSGICTGWGWLQYLDSRYCRDNKINFNRLHKVMQMSFDGGAIYCLGNQPNSQIIGNYISDQPNNLSGIYLDSGSQFHTIKENVIEDTPVSFYSGATDDTVRGSAIFYDDNYVTSSKTIFVSTHNVRYDGTEIFMPGNYASGALETMERAGIAEKWQYIKEIPGENEWEYEYEIKVNNAKKEVIMGLMHDAKFKEFYLQYFLQSAREWMRSIEIGNGLWQYPQAAVDEYKAFLGEAEEVLLKTVTDRDEILHYRYQFDIETNKLAASRNKPSKTELLEMSGNLLNQTPVGSAMGNVSQKTHNELSSLINDAANTSEEIAVLKLESYIQGFEDKKVNLDIFDVKIDGQIGKTVIDRDNATIDVTVKHTADMAKLSPKFEIHETAKVNAAGISLKEGSAVYSVTSLDGKAEKQWTLRAQKPEIWSSDMPLDLTEIVNDTDNWYKFGSYNYNNYSGKLIGDGTVEFTVKIDAVANDWPSLVLRSQEYDTSFQDVGNDAYVMVFTPGNIEFYRFNDGVRLQFYGNVPGCETIFGGNIQTDVFKFGEENDFAVTTKQEDGGLRIKIDINGENIVDFVDNYEGCITQPGYIGSVSPNAAVIIGGKR